MKPCATRLTSCKREVDMYREQNKKLVEFIFKMKNNELRH